MAGQASATRRSTPTTSSATRRSSWRRQLPVLLVVFLLACTWLPSTAAAAASCSDAGSTLEARADGGAPSQQLSPRPTPSRSSRPLAERIKTYRSRPQPKVAYVRPGGQPMIRRSTDVTRRAGDASCLAPGTTAAEINALFASKGASAGVLDLCPGTIYLLEETIFFTAPGQGLRTLGGAAVARSQRAELRIASAGISTALNSMNCVDCDSLLVEDLLFNGSRGTYGPLKGGEALIELGGASKGHSVLRSKIFDTRGWSSLHFIEGYRLDCSDATVTDNEIGPSGQSYNEGPIADGISLSCRNSLVTRNTIFDATDGAIVIFGSPGSLITDNTITTSNALTLGGVNMVDYAPFSGDYRNTRVTNNRFKADGNAFKIGIAVGPAIWGDDVTNVNVGGIVTDNVFSGPDNIFGVAVSGVANFTVTGNRADSTARFGGVQTGNCHGISSKVAPTFALYDRDKTAASVDFGSDANCWSVGIFQYLLCYERGASPGSPVSPAFLLGGPGCSSGTPSPVRPADWTDLKLCLRDSNTRVLDGTFIQTDANSVAFCLDRCRGLDYAYAGLENSNQCWCGNKINRGSGFGSIRPLNTCSLPCAGNASESCGGANYGLSLFQDLAQVPVSFDPNAGSDWQDSDYCLRDSPTRILADWTDNSAYMSRQYCQTQCAILGYPLAGLENAGECRCGSTVAVGPSYGMPRPMIDCRLPCRGAPAETCGGSDYSLHLFYDAARIAKPVAPFTNNTSVSSSVASSSASSSAAPSSSAASSSSVVFSSSSTASSASSSSASAPLPSGSASCSAKSARRQAALTVQTAPTASSQRLAPRATAGA